MSCAVYARHSTNNLSSSWAEAGYRLTESFGLPFRRSSVGQTDMSGRLKARLYRSSASALARVTRASDMSVHLVRIDVRTRDQ